MAACVHGPGFVNYQAALRVREGSQWGGHAWHCHSCGGWHSKPAVARDWVKEPLLSKSGPKPQGYVNKDDDDL